jgi:putative nucleotidyltransferase with HDIG domain
MDKKTILFVDDEIHILEGLRTRLHKQRSKWDMLFANSGQEALGVMAANPVDVLVTDMRMPEMDGLTLLKRTQQEFPQVVRIVLSGHAELEAALRAIHVAHQFLCKPCDASIIENVIDRACLLQTLLHDEAIEKMVSGMKRLPAPPSVYTELMLALNSEFASPLTIGRVLRQNEALCAKTLQLVNSASFQYGRKITEVDEAVTYLGYNMIRQIVLSISVFQQPGKPARPNPALDMLHTHSCLVGALAAQMMADRKEKEDAFIAGLLHDIGKLILVLELPAVWQRSHMEMRMRPRALHEVELSQLGTSHAEIGAHLLERWGMPYPVIEAVANHHFPSRVPCQEFGVLAAVHAADFLIQEQMKLVRPSLAGSAPALDVEFLKSLDGADRQLPRWREWAQEQISTGAKGLVASIGSMAR